MINPTIIAKVREIGPYVLAASLFFFLLGKYTATITVSKDYESKYAEAVQKVEETTKSQYQQQLSSQIVQIKAEYEAKIAKITDTSKVTVIAKDGTTTITEKTKVAENTEVKTNTDSSKKTDTADTTQVASKTTNTDTKTVNSEKKEVTTTTAAAKFRFYGMAVTEVYHDTDFKMSYGSGVMYDVLFANVGVLGIYTPTTGSTSVGFTLGISL